MQGVDETCWHSRLQLAGVTYAHVPMVDTSQVTKLSCQGNNGKAGEQKTHRKQFCLPGA